MRTLYSAMAGRVTRRTEEKIKLAESRSAQLAESAKQPMIARDAAHPITGDLRDTKFQQLEARVDRAIADLLELREEIRRMKT